MIAEYDGSNTLLRKFIYGPGIDEPICMIDCEAGNVVYYYHFDGVGSVIALSNENKEIVERYSYDVFGGPNTTSTIGNPYLFTGRRYDVETALYYYRARYYDYVIGRFLQTDPIGYNDGLNLYAYCENNPVNRRDSFGLFGGPAMQNLPEKMASMEQGRIELENKIERRWESIQMERSKRAEPLSRERFEQLMAPTVNSVLQRSRFGGIFFLDPRAYYVKSDSIFWKEYKTQVFEYQGIYFTGEEINYYVQGLLQRHYRNFEWLGALMVNAHNMLYGHEATRGELIWTLFGREEYDSLTQKFDIGELSKGTDTAYSRRR